MSDEIRDLLAREEDARRIAQDGVARARAIQQEASRKRTERLVRAREEAKQAAAERRARILAGAEPACAAAIAQGRQAAARLKEGGSSRVDVAVQAARQWILFGGAEHVRRR